MGSDSPLKEMMEQDLKGMRETRQFSTGATRDTDEGKYDYEGFMSPLVQKRFGEFMHKHRLQSDGKLRDSDNWQRGIPKDQYIKSAARHYLDWWLIHRGFAGVATEGLQEALCALRFNIDGYLHELLKEELDVPTTTNRD